MKRTTINNPVELSGAGLFSAQTATLQIAPNKNGSGIIFENQGESIPAHIASLSQRPIHPAFAQLKPRCTSVGNANSTFATIEHLLSACVGVGLSDARIKVLSDTTHCETPILDGSALPFAKAIESVGIHELDLPLEPAIITESIHVVDGESSITIEPAAQTSYSYTLDYSSKNHDSTIPGAQVHWDMNKDFYRQHIAPARTFCLESEAQAMLAAGLFEHLSTQDMLVVGESGPINNSYRMEHECAYHKLLDLIGDLALVARPIRAKISAVRSGHALAHEAARRIVEQVNSEKPVL